jgi:hypothetical protein
LSKQERINECLALAYRGEFHRDSIKTLIRADFKRQLIGNVERMKLYDRLAKRYGFSRVHIMNIVNG